MRQIEYWRWRYRDVQTGQICRTKVQLTADDAADFSEAERIPGTMTLREIEEDFSDTVPRVFQIMAHC